MAESGEDRRFFNGTGTLGDSQVRSELLLEDVNKLAQQWPRIRRRCRVSDIGDSHIPPESGGDMQPEVATTVQGGHTGQQGEKYRVLHFGGHRRLAARNTTWT